LPRNQLPDKGLQINSIPSPGGTAFAFPSRWQAQKATRRCLPGMLRTLIQVHR
jgi:hypothetical protein